MYSSPRTVLGRQNLAALALVILDDGASSIDARRSFDGEYFAIGLDAESRSVSFF
jgi:hypothetical protein